MTGLQVPNANQELLREELTRFSVQSLERLRSKLRALEVIAFLSPLLGLPGTVLGMTGRLPKSNGSSAWNASRAPSSFTRKTGGGTRTSSGRGSTRNVCVR